MAGYTRVLVGDVLDTCPWAHDVFRAYGLEPAAVDPSMTIDSLCWFERITLDGFTRALMAAERMWKLEFGDDASDWGIVPHVRLALR